MQIIRTLIVLFFSAVAVSLPGVANAQKNVSYASMEAHGLSPKAAKLLFDLRSGKPKMESYIIVKSDGKACVSAFVIPSEGVDVKQLTQMDVSVISMGKQWSVLIPVENFEALVASGLCRYIDLGREIKLHNNRVRGAFAADHIHSGEGLLQGYDGTGVIVGVIDIGFEFGHPTFLDSTGSTLRIKRVWSQLDTTGVAPEGFPYGSEYTTPEQILAAERDGYPHTHGTHVAGTAAGCGAPDARGRIYRGVAPAADLVLVGSNLSEVGIFDAIRYIHRYARSVGKPCVINMSLGSLMGSHDGMTGIDASIESYLNAPAHTDSIVLVSSASNDGNMPVHLNKQLSATDTTLETALYFIDTVDVYIPVDIWGSVGNSFDVELRVLDKSADTMMSFGPLMRCVAGADSIYVFNLSVPNGGTPYECTVTVEGMNPLNQRPHVNLEINNVHKSTPMDHELLLTVRSTSGEVHLWSEGGYFTSTPNYPAARRGDDQYTIGGIDGNGTSAISVGSYNSRQAWKRIDGTMEVIITNSEGDISNFSSHGPTIDGRTKPDICTPGSLLVSSVSRFWPDYLVLNYLYDSVVWNGNTEYYATMQGTSMASPAAAGVVALWLQENPARNVDSIRAIIHATALQDEFTGNITAEGDNSWGWGKLNALGGLPVTSPFYNVTLQPENFNMGTVEGMGRHPQGMHTITACPAPGLVFTRWNDGVVDNPRQVNLTSDTSFMAFFGRENECDTLDEFPMPLEYNEYVNCWYNLDINGDGNSWANVMDWLMVIAYGPSADKWLITPPVKIVQGLGLHFVADMLNGAIKLSVSVAEESVSPSDFTTTLFNQNITLGTAVDTVVDLSPYAGHTMRLALRAYETSGSAILRLGNTEFILREVGIEDVDDASVSYTLDGLTLTLNNTQGRMVAVYDAVGRQITASKWQNSTFTLPAAGVYTIHIDNNTSRKIIAIK